MKKGVFLIIIFCITKLSFAQIGMISADFGSVGDSIIFSVDDFYVGNVFMGTKGPSETWDYEFLTSSSKDTLLFLDPQSIAGGIIFNSNLVLRNNFIDTYWENNPNDLFIKGVGFAFDFSIIDSTDSLRSVFMRYPNGLHQAQYFMEYENYINRTAEGIIQVAIQDTIEVPNTGNIYIDSVRITDNATILDSINGEGILHLPTDTLECLRQELRIIHSISVEVKILDPIFGVFMVWVPVSQFIDIPIPNLNEHYIRYWAKGQAYPILEFTLDTLGNASRTQYLFNTVEYIAGINNKEKIIKNLYPNPTQNNINLTLNNENNVSEINIYNLLGTLLSHFSTSKPNASIDLSGYGNGFYFIEVVSKFGREMKKIQKF